MGWSERGGAVWDGGDRGGAVWDGVRGEGQCGME